MWKVKERGRLVIAAILMLSYQQIYFAGKWPQRYFKDQYNNNLTIQALVQAQSCKSKHL